MTGRLLSEEGIARFGEVARSHVADGEVPGLVALVARGAEVHVEALGSLSVGGPPVRRNSLFRIASTTKVVTGIATMAVVGRGLVGLDEPVARILPEPAGPRVLRRMDGALDETEPARRPVTVRQLANFTFGFGACAEMWSSPGPWPVVRAAEDLHLATLGPPAPGDQPDPDSWMEALGSLPLLAEPGERWLYNTGASVLGVLLARATATPFDEMLAEWVFEPLGMRDTAFYARDPARLPTAYGRGPDGLQVFDPPEGQWSRPPAFPDGAAGLVSTADDLLGLGRTLLAGGAPLLRPEAVAEMTRDQLSAEQREGARVFLAGRTWGLCVSIVTDGPRAGSIGWDGGLGTSFLVDPALGLVVVVLTQRLFDTPQAPQVHVDLQRAAFGATR
ncbi:MAG TPA: serine hydrolase domain-containing protein [Acidimicrobiales bacterium]|nr:serine hydrolase domain-containing protein [Acidimicrobiales bacterium]